MYDLQRDPHQLSNVAGDEHYAPTQDRLRQQLNGQLASSDDPRVAKAARQPAVARPWPASVFAACDRGFVLVAAHRGGYASDRANRAPENSLANLEVAITAGYDVYETDIQRTSDGVFVIVHDKTLTRETTGTGEAKGMTLSELKTLKKRYRDESVSEQSVATLKELLQAGKGRILFKPDLKPGVIDHFAELAQLISNLEMTDQVFLRTDFKNVNAIKEHFAAGCPRVEVMFKTKTAAQVMTIVKDFHPKTIQIDLAKDESISPAKRGAIQQAVKAGVVVETHTYGDPAQWQTLAELGVRMFHTTNPDATLAYLKNNGWRNGFSREATQPEQKVSGK